MLPQRIDNIDSLCEQKGDIVYQEPAKQLDWLLALGNALSGLYKIENLTIQGQNKVLYSVFKAWSDIETPLSRDATYKWDYDFMKWAKRYTQKRSIEPSEETIENKITVYRDWIAEPIIEFPEFVTVPERDEFGEETGQFINIPFDPSDCDYSKQLVARGTAKKGEMTEKAWSMMIDSYATVDQLKSEIRLKSNQADRIDDLTFFDNGGIICASQYGHTVPILASLFENSQDPLFKDAVSHVYRVLGLKIPMELIA